MLRIALLLAIIVNTSPAFGEVDEETKKTALKLGYILNGNSMVRWGSIDLSRPNPPPCANCSPAPANPREKLK